MPELPQLEERKGRVRAHPTGSRDLGAGSLKPGAASPHAINFYRGKQMIDWTKRFNDERLMQFAAELQRISAQIGFEVSSRSFCA
jgi:hypothetical protein